MAIPKAYQRQQTKNSVKPHKRELSTLGQYKGISFIILGITCVLSSRFLNYYDYFTTFITSVKKPQFSFGRSVRAATTADSKTAEQTGTEQATNTQAPDQGINFDPLSATGEKELAVLSSLAKRRKELDKRESDISQKEINLQTIEKQVKERLDFLKKVKDEVDSSLKKIDDEEKKKFGHFVKIYEGMKPKQAAKIFNQLDNRILKEFAVMMNQKKLADIFGVMSSQKVKELMILIAQEKNPYAAVAPQKQN